MPRAGSGVVRIDLLRFLARCCKRQLYQVLAVLYLSIFLVYCCSLGPLFMFSWFVLVCVVSWFWLFSQYFPSDWLESLLLRYPDSGEGSSPQSPGWRVFMIILVYCIVALFNCVFVLFPVLHNVPRVGSGVVRIDPLRFLAGCRKRRLNQVQLCHIS